MIRNPTPLANLMGITMKVLTLSATNDIATSAVPENKTAYFDDITV